MFTRLAGLVIRRARIILIVSVLLLIGAAVLGVGAFGKLSGGGFDDPKSDSTRAENALEATFSGQTNLLFLVSAKTGDVDAAPVADVGRDLTTRLGRERDVQQVTSYWTARSPSLKSQDGRAGLVLIRVTDRFQDEDDAAKHLRDTYSGDRGAATVRAGGQLGANQDITERIGKDLAFAEGIAIPITLVLLLIAFGSLIAALLPLVIGIVAIFGTLAVLSVLADITNVSIYALNLTTAMGLGLAIDYSLLMVNRYREELAAGSEPPEAVTRTLATAGRTVVFAAGTVAVALAALLMFPLYFLRSFAYAGIAVTIVAMLAATVLLPALLTLLGRRVNAVRVGPRRALAGGEAPFWRKVATVVSRRPVLAGLPVVALLLVLGAPFLHVSFGTPDDRVLRTDQVSRQVGDVLRADFASKDSSSLYVVSSGPIAADGLRGYATRLSRLDGVARVDAATGSYRDGREIAPAGPANARFTGGDRTYLSVVPAVDPASGAAQHLVRDVRALSPPDGASVLVGGPSAALVDGKTAIADRLPFAIGLMALTTMVLLFLFTGSVLLPVKALVLNALSLTAVLGAAVWIFQDGHLAWALDVTPTPLSTTMPVLLFCIAFGLSMDYEIFLLSRIRELHVAGADNTEAVAGGLARTGRLVTTAAALLAVTFFAFGTSQVSFIQMFGIGTGVAIVVDATLIRGVLVPAFMRLAGDANWWAPAPLRRLHARVGLSEG